VPLAFGKRWDFVMTWTGTGVIERKQYRINNELHFWTHKGSVLFIVPCSGAWPFFVSSGFFLEIFYNLNTYSS
jgi:hypothetical protein